VVEPSSKCGNASVRAEALEEAVWLEACQLLNNPQNLQQEYQRRLHSSDSDHSAVQQNELKSQMKKIQKGIERLIDAYTEETISKLEFEPRLRSMRARLQILETQLRDLKDEESRSSELKLVIGRLEEFATQVADGLETLDWFARREVIRTLVKRVEVYPDKIKVVFRVGTGPLVSRAVPNSEDSSHCCERVRLVHPPRIIRLIPMRTEPFIEFWDVAQPPPMDRGMIDLDPSLCHHFFQIPVAQRITAIPPHIQQDDLWQKMPPLKQGLGSHLGCDERKLSFPTVSFLRHNPKTHAG
jgi:hypothetical protein